MPTEVAEDKEFLDEDEGNDDDKDESGSESTDSDDDNSPPMMYGHYRSRLIVKGKESTSRPKRKKDDDDDDFVYNPASDEALETEETPIIPRKRTRSSVPVDPTPPATTSSQAHIPSSSQSEPLSDKEQISALEDKVKFLADKMVEMTDLISMLNR